MTDRSLYYGMDGQPISSEKANALFEGDFEKTRRVAADEIGDFSVSTVLLVIDHSFGYGGPPLIFETMIFGPEDHDLAGWQRRYATREQAETGHAEACELVREAVAA